MEDMCHLPFITGNFRLCTFSKSCVLEMCTSLPKTKKYLTGAQLQYLLRCANLVGFC